MAKRPSQVSGDSVRPGAQKTGSQAPPSARPSNSKYLGEKHDYISYQEGKNPLGQILEDGRALLPLGLEVIGDLPFPPHFLLQHFSPGEGKAHESSALGILAFLRPESCCCKFHQEKGTFHLCSSLPVFMLQGGEEVQWMEPLVPATLPQASCKTMSGHAQSLDVLEGGDSHSLSRAFSAVSGWCFVFCLFVYF